ncbi:Alcohol dehydrogenase superfamily, zinc-type [Cordyceps fumosorosea ARSEF 2679]|uniref:Alcohol dehydrogenase superfamily, zinc-type n=1 Tax=Cordyceps fumosorosea (strain ARSEF 2679) TaxID=1081104 RepID=A0A166VTQ5_CORFA|nr:Alcohol dehydrogenase superfamily, zinc-type [Cordyceps fumosorosea ARSEF 2679]OAA34020.1 Alcohol dehydrogenase superfamily, zinc-type [Cordyceps fumosorosea ARSEF 2679]
MLPVPRGWSFTEAAGLFISVSTAYGALLTRAAMTKNDVVLVHAAAGGTGLAAIQGMSYFLAKACGATVIATASTARKLDVPKSFGADYTVNYTDPDWPQKVKEITPGNRGVDIVFDPVGLVNASSKCTAWNGKILIIGFARGVVEMVPTNKVLLKNISLVGFHGEAYAYNERRTLVDNWGAIFGLIRDGKVRPMVFSDRDFTGLDAVKDALISLKDRETWGKVTVQIPKVADSHL